MKQISPNISTKIYLLASKTVNYGDFMCTQMIALHWTALQMFPGKRFAHDQSLYWLRHLSSFNGAKWFNNSPGRNSCSEDLRGAAVTQSLANIDRGYAPRDGTVGRSHNRVAEKTTYDIVNIYQGLQCSARNQFHQLHTNVRISWSRVN